MDVATGLVLGVRQVLSPHFDARPAGTVADLIVVHGVSLPPGEFGGPWIDRLFTGHLPPDAHPYF
ncbi:MAG: 1,6-anhydro-N-acetylmuramyl-L-alanine amidase AmpD, partial [Gammaproteobacteria bacterium]